MSIILDLDHTLFDTEKHKKEIAKIFKLSLKNFLNDYAKFFKNKEINYNVYKHLSILLKLKRIKKEEATLIRKKIINLMEKSDDFLFPQAEDLVKKLYQDKKNIILLSFGDHVFQSQKIKYLSIKKYFKKIIITNKDKDQIIGFLKKSKEAHVIINDKPRESLALKKELSLAGVRSRIILVRGPYSKNAPAHKKFYALKDVGKALELNLKQKKQKSGGLKIKVLNNGREVVRLFLYILFNDLHSRPFAIIEDVFVGEDFRYQGISKKLLEKAIKEAKKAKCYKILMWSRYSKPHVHNIYKNIGFKEWGKEFRMNL
jgi:GNAT superfamily N-acetyltransferase